MDKYYTDAVNRRRRSNWGNIEGELEIEIGKNGSLGLDQDLDLDLGLGLGLVDAGNSK